MNTNLFYYKDLNSIGGIETFFWSLARKYGKEFDITIMYETGDPAQIKRLSDLVRVKKYRQGERIKCKRFFVTFNVGILDYVDAEEYYQLLHGDYRSLGVVPGSHPKIQEWVAVSQTVRDSYADITGKIADVCYNPFIPVKPNKILHLVSATRLSADKGLKRMEILAKALDEAGVKYTWMVFTDSPRVVSNPNVVLREPRLDVVDFIADADYFVQLSDAEGYCYSVVEALSVGTPVIVTDFPVAQEIGVVNGKNGFILPKDMSNLPIAQICKGLKKFTYMAPEDKWRELLRPAPPDYEEQMKKPTQIVCVKQFYDLERDKLVDAGETWTVPMKRAEVLCDLGVTNILEG